MQQFEYNDVYSNEFMIISLGVSAIVLLIAGFIKDGKKNFDTLKNCGFYAVGAGLSNGMTSTLSLITTAVMPISIVSPTRAGIKIMFSFLLSVFFYKEKILKATGLWCCFRRGGLGIFEYIVRDKTRCMTLL